MKHLNFILLIFCFSFSANATHNLSSDCDFTFSKELPLVDLVMNTGDTITGYFLKSITMDEVLVMSIAKDRKRFTAKSGELVEIILHQDPFLVHIDLVNLKHNNKRGDFRPGYAIRVIDGALRRYDGVRPLSGTIQIPMISGGFGGFALSMTAKGLKSATFDQWIIYKGGKSYRFNNFYEWEDIRKEMFKDDKGFEEYLIEKKVNQSKIEFILRAYNYYAAEKDSNKSK